ncbi:MAG: hypothetical protein EPO23_03430 [Xanthobacteraceae bacterium]|nr:MAG: hypothetical protein EPO23_03430 [Xanthobacteraceae bacterium]
MIDGERIGTRAADGTLIFAPGLQVRPLAELSREACDVSTPPPPPPDFNADGWDMTCRVRLRNGLFGARIERLWIKADGQAVWRRERLFEITLKDSRGYDGALPASARSLLSASTVTTPPPSPVAESARMEPDMTLHTTPAAIVTAAPTLIKAAATRPALIVTGRETIGLRAGTGFAGHLFAADTPVAPPGGGYQIGADYAVIIGDDGVPRAGLITGIPDDPRVLGGFHFAPGGNAPARAGGDDITAINPCSCWDLNFRPACPDPRGMVFVESLEGPFWCDIYLTAADHLTHGTSAFGVTIADGDDPPQRPGGKTRFKKFNCTTARAVLAHHGKGLLSTNEFAAAAIGGTEQTACGQDPVITGLDAPRTNRSGVMQPFGSLSVWGHDGDPDTPRASLFGGSWIFGGSAGSRYANVACYWPDFSSGLIGARGRGDHLQLD